MLTPHDRATSLGLDGLELANNLHLFQWSGYLIKGDGTQITAPPPTPKQTDVTDWVYGQEGETSIATNDIPSAQSVPDEYADEFRLTEAPTRAIDHTPTLTRPTPAALFDAIQSNQDAVLMAEMPPSVRSLLDRSIWNPPEPDCDSMGILEGGKWIETQNDRRTALSRLASQISDKLKTIAREQQRYADRARIPVLDIDGSVHEGLMLTNIAVCMVAIEKLQRLGEFAQGFWRGAVDREY